MPIAIAGIAAARIVECALTQDGLSRKERNVGDGQ